MKNASVFLMKISLMKSSPGCRILIDDGLIQLEVEDVFDNEMVCSILNGGTLGSKKSINLPGMSIELPALTEKTVVILFLGFNRRSIMWQHHLSENPMMF